MPVTTKTKRTNKTNRKPRVPSFAQIIKRSDRESLLALEIQTAVVEDSSRSDFFYEDEVLVEVRKTCNPAVFFLSIKESDRSPVLPIFAAVKIDWKNEMVIDCAVASPEYLKDSERGEIFIAHCEQMMFDAVTRWILSIG